MRWWTLYWANCCLPGQEWELRSRRWAADRGAQDGLAMKIVGPARLWRYSCEAPERALGRRMILPRLVSRGDETIAHVRGGGSKERAPAQTRAGRQRTDPRGVGEPGIRSGLPGGYCYRGSLAYRCHPAPLPLTAEGRRQRLRDTRPRFDLRRG